MLHTDAFNIAHFVGVAEAKNLHCVFAVEVLIALSRFWAQRSNWSQEKNRYVILGVTGPNEYENNVSNNWYTNTLARWTLKYTSDILDWLRSASNPCL